MNVPLEESKRTIERNEELEGHIHEAECTFSELTC